VADELEDGAATIAWLKQQPWYNGKLALTGISYMGFTAWASAGGEEWREVAAIIPVCTQSRVRSAAFLPQGAVALELMVLWLYLVLRLLAKLRRPWTFLQNAARGLCEGLPGKGMWHLPLSSLDTLVLGGPVPFLQEALEDTSETGRFWGRANVLCEFTPGEVPPVSILTGWHDFFLEEALVDYQRALDAGQEDVRLTIGTFSHWEIARPDRLRIHFRVLLDSLHKHCGNPRAATVDAPPTGSSGGHPAEGYTCGSHPVELQLYGSERWVGFASWPPPPREERDYTLHAAGVLLADEEKEGGAQGGYAAGEHAAYVYDPHSPTPCRGGPSFNTLNGGAKCQSSQFRFSRLWRTPIEERGDVLVFSTRPLTHAILVVGTIELTVEVSATDALEAGRHVRSLDLLGRLCRVDAATGASYNLCEGLRRLTEDDLQGRGCTDRVVRIALGATACEFQVGDRIRLHVCSAAHPRWMRNLGSQWDGRLQGLKDSTLGPPEEGKVAVRVRLGASWLRLPLLSS